MGKFYWAFGAAVLLAVVTAGGGQASEILLGTGEFPPFATEKTEDKGCAVKIVRSAYEAEGWSVELQFLSWPRNLVELSRGSIDASAYWAKRSDRLEDYVFPENPVTSATSKFVFPSDAVIHWDSYEDLRGKTILINKDYSYTEDFYQALEDYGIRTEIIPDISQNLFMILRGRADLTIMNAKVLEKYMAELSDEQRSMLRVDPKPALKIDGFPMFSKSDSDKAQALVEVFDRGYEKIRFRQDLEETFKTCGF